METIATLQFVFTRDAFRLDSGTRNTTEGVRSWAEWFERDCYHALYQFGLEELPAGSGSSAVFLHLVADGFFKTLTDIPGLELMRQSVKVEPAADMLERLMRAVPYAIGAEHITPKWVKGIFGRLRDIFAEEIEAYEGTVEMYLTEKSQRLRVPERVFFHLVDNKEPGNCPFAFLATYATGERKGRVRHVPLQYALTEYRDDRQKLLNLLSCLNKAAERSTLIAEFMESGEMFHPLRLTSEEAYRFLKDIPAIEEAGILCRIPNWWKRKAAAVSLSVSLGEEKPSMVGFDALVSMKPSLVVDGMVLTEDEIRALLEQTEGLVYLKGKWIEVNHARLEELLKRMEEYQGDVTLRDAIHMELGTKNAGDAADVGPLVTNGAWLSELLQHLRTPSAIRSLAVPKSFQATLRKYQKTGYTWLDYMDRLGFGACLADDMGLGKTVQVLAYLERIRKTQKNARILLIVPASLLGNWKKETCRFAPQMELQVLHGKPASEMAKALKGDIPFLTITTYGMACRMKELQDVEWQCLILDEAQAIKNPGTKQTRAIKKISSRMRIAMTGTPIENDLTNLWSLFDFLNRGLMGSAQEFHDFSRRLHENPEGYQKLKQMVSPFILRRVKTDKRVISDLPDKLETIDYVGLSKKQIVLYRRQVAELEEKLQELEGFERCGLVLATIIRLKQICNHPDQYLGQQAYAPEESGKFDMLRELCETIYEKRERVLVFTQFKEITDHLAAFLEEIFHAKGFVLHGSTPVAMRSKMVDEFNGENYVPFMVLSVKAGGTGLNLTAANHVIHFDRWWNPAVENQATDRAYRIGQRKDVMVHKLVCEKTVEERIDAVINSKRELADSVIGSGGENWITELSNEELLDMLRLR